MAAMEVLTYDCLNCCLQQIVSVADMLGLSGPAKERVVRESLAYLSGADYTVCTPAVMGGLWEVLTRHADTDDPYRAIKDRCNGEAMKMAPAVRERISLSSTPFETALKYAIAGNLIDFAMQQAFTLDEQNSRIDALAAAPFAMDHSGQLKTALMKADSLLYLCDNAGEIIFDQLFLAEVKREHPGLHILCGVRGKPVINDAVMQDAAFAGMDAVAELIDNGDGAAGTVLAHTTPAFQEAFRKADVVIAKGQGNYESLGGADKENLFFLFMVKCKPVADAVGLPPMSVVCMRNN